MQISPPRVVTSQLARQQPRHPMALLVSWETGRTTPRTKALERMTTSPSSRIRNGSESEAVADLSAQNHFQGEDSRMADASANYANLPIDRSHANFAAACIADITPSTSGALAAATNWAEQMEAAESGEDSFTVVKHKRRRRESPNRPVEQRSSGVAASRRTGATPRRRPTAGGATVVQQIRATRADIADARVQQRSSTEDNCVFVEHCPDFGYTHYLQAVEELVGGAGNVLQVMKMDSHMLVGLSTKALAERLLRDGLEIGHTHLRAFLFKKRAERITVANLPFFVDDAAIIEALRPYGDVTSIVPIRLRAGRYTFTDGRREVFILLKEGFTLEKIPTRVVIRNKGNVLSAFISYGVKCSRCGRQGHRRANCPINPGRASNNGQPQPAPLPPGASSTVSRQQSRPTPAAPALPMEETPSAPPPVTPAPPLQAPEGPVGPRPAGLQHPEPPPARPDLVAPRGPLPVQKTLGPAAPTLDVEMSIVEETFASSTSSAKNATRVDLDAFIEGHPSVSFGETDALGLGREEVLDLLFSRTKAQRKGPLLSPPQCDALVGLIGQILDLRPGAASNLYKVLGQVKAELRTTPAVPPTPPLPTPRPAETAPPAPQGKESAPAEVAYPPPLPVKMTDEARKKWLLDLFKELNYKTFLVPLLGWIRPEQTILAALHSGEERNDILGAHPNQRSILANFLGSVIERARGVGTVRGVKDHRGVAPGQEVGNDEGCVAGGIIIVELDRVFNVSPHACDPAFQSPEHLQIQSLLLDKQVEEALELVKFASKSTLPKEQTEKLVQRVYQQAGFIKLFEGSFDQAMELLLQSDIDPREVIRLFPGLLLSTSSYARVFPPLHDLASIDEVVAPQGTTAFLTFLLHYLEAVRSVVYTTCLHSAVRPRVARAPEEHCVYLENGPKLQPFHYLRALDRLLGGTAGVVQVSKVNGHQLLGLASRGLAERLINNGLEVEGTLLRAFPIRKRAERITVGNLPFFVEDSAIIKALGPYGRITSIAPKMMKAGPYTYTDGRREAFIVLHEGVTTERLPTRVNITIKGEAWPAYLSSGIKYSRCHGQGHRRANCPLLAGQTTAPGPATPTSPTSVPPATAPRLPQQPSAQPPPPASPSPTMEVSDVPPTSRAALHPPAALRQPPPAPSALPAEDAPPAPPPVTPAPSLRTPGSREPAAPTPDVEMSIVDETSAFSTSSAKNATRVDLDAFIERHPSMSFAKTSSPRRPKRRGMDPSCRLLTSNLYKVLGQVKAELRTTPAAVPTHPPPAPRPAEPAPPAPHGEKTTPDMATPPPPLSPRFIDERWREAHDIIDALGRETYSEHLSELRLSEGDITDAIICPEDREPLLRRLSTRRKNLLAEIISAAVERARDIHPFARECLHELRRRLPP
ncbi:TGFBRAP1 [Cordylochernes scorpioides]|uniref:TGFBRAP1 n=1 Tax=Cordylochernes scorpioides TaxID=51811 RepID=A0ABY6K9F6_9ARAC|nr:TGFBRAP1 [Cordylochernes scorpioides]